MYSAQGTVCWRRLTAYGRIASSVALWGCGGGGGSSSSSSTPPPTTTVARAACGAGDTPESALQGQVPASLRTPGGFKGFSCNLQLVGQVRGDGASWQHAWFVDKAGHNCSYFDTASATANRTHVGVWAIDATNASAPTATAYLQTTAMIDPWES